MVLPDANAATSGSLQALQVGRAAYIFFLPPFLPFDMRLFLPTAILAAGNPRTPPPGAVCVQRGGLLALAATKAAFTKNPEAGAGELCSCAAAGDWQHPFRGVHSISSHVLT